MVLHDQLHCSYVDLQISLHTTKAPPIVCTYMATRIQPTHAAASSPGRTIRYRHYLVHLQYIPANNYTCLHIHLSHFMECHSKKCRRPTHLPKP